MLFPSVRHEVSFWHGSDRLIGDLRLPVAAGPHPVVMLVRDPKHLERDYSAWLDSLADAGIASFSWDRPGHFRGAGVWLRQVGHHAREVLAGIDRLRCLPDLDATAIALLGWGEGGWAAAQATTFSNRVAALILACTPAATGTGATQADPARHDVRPTLSAVTVPVLALFGEQDPVVPLEGSVRGVREALHGAGHIRHEIAVVRGGDHALRVRPPHGLGPMIDGRHRFGDWPPGLTDLIVRWLERHLRPEEIPSYPPPLQAPLVRVPVRSRTALPPAVPVRQVRRRVTS